VRGCVGSPTSTRNKANSQYISKVQTSPYKPVLWVELGLKLISNKNT